MDAFGRREFARYRRLVQSGMRNNNSLRRERYFHSKKSGRLRKEAAQEKERKAELREQRERELAEKNKMRDEIIALLPSLNAVANYVRDSEDYFTTSQKVFHY